MAVYNSKDTAMVIFAKAKYNKTDANGNPLFPNVESPNTINPDGSNTPFNPPTPNTPNIPTTDLTASNSTGLTFKDAIVGLGIYGAVKNVANYYKNNYGDIMQDSNAQAEINEAMNLINMGLNIGVGFAVGGVVGGIASIIGTGVNVGLQTASYQRMLHRNNVQSQIMMDRTNYASINGGR